MKKKIRIGSVVTVSPRAFRQSKTSLFLNWTVSEDDVGVVVKQDSANGKPFDRWKVRFWRPLGKWAWQKRMSDYLYLMGEDLIVHLDPL